MMNAAGVLARGRGDYEQALAHFARASAIAERALPEEHSFRFTLRYNQGQVMLLQGEATAARDLFAEQLQIALAKLPDGHPDRVSMAQGLGQSGAALGDTALIQQALAQLRLEAQSAESENPFAVAWIRAFELFLNPADGGDPSAAELLRSVEGSGDRQLIDFVKGLVAPGAGDE